MKEQRVPELLLERYLLGELTSIERESIEKRLRNEPGGMERLEELNKSNQSILNEFPPSIISKNIKNLYQFEMSKENAGPVKETKSSSIFSPIKYAVRGFSMIALLIAVFIPLYLFNYKQNNGLITDETRTKGQTSLFIFRKTNTGEEVLKDGDIVNKGDILQLAYNAGVKEKFGVIFSIDGKGNLTWHYPYSLQGDSSLSPGKKTLLNESYELDNAPDFERFFLICSSSKINTRLITEKAGKLAENYKQSLELSRSIFGNYKIIIVTLRKGEKI